MPRDCFSIAWHLAEEMRTPANDIVTKNVTHQCDDSRMSQNVIYRTVTEVRGTDRVAVPTRRDHASKQIIEVVTDFVSFLFRINAKTFQLAIAIKFRHLIDSQRLRIRNC